NAKWHNYLKQYNVDEKRIVIAGECAMDPIYHKIANMKEISHGKKELLFITTALVEHGRWTPAMRDKTVIQVVKAITENFPDARLTIKIHPGEPLQHYKEIIESINP